MSLVDTHAILWLAQAPEMLSARARNAVADARSHGLLAISDKSLWELAMMAQRGHIDIKTSSLAFLQAVERNFRVLPITAAIAERSIQFSARYPKDPTDRIIGATALVHGLKLITADKPIHKSGEVPCIW